MLIINTEYLVAPLICRGEFLEQYVEDLRIINEIIDDANIQVFKEYDILSEMGKVDFYPSDSFFKKIISQDKDTKFSANDIVRTLYKLISAAPEFSNDIENYDIEWKPQVTAPILSYLSDDRKSHYRNLFHKVIFQSILFQRESYIFSIQKNSSYNTNFDIEIDAGITLIEPDVLGEMPFNINQKVTMFGSVRDVIINLNGYDIYKRVDSIQSLKLSFYFGVLNYLSTNNLKRSISWDDFDIGRAFYKSLVNNQCAHTQKFSALLYDMVLRIICRKREDLDVNPFRKSKDSKEQIVFEGLKGFRCHLTKHHEGLRLMFWLDPETRRLILANVGPKMELVIAEP
ncbi:hypothetical protein TUM17576_51980 [Enterobacter hormaechei]|nr:hypothetical protein [Enterobacter hormaechei]GJL38378.1 hypothetical protein TUM17576_51980 [Enterobacter hormaechei]